MGSEISINVVKSLKVMAYLTFSLKFLDAVFQYIPMDITWHLKSATFDVSYGFFQGDTFISLSLQSKTLHVQTCMCV